uniref:NADH dehydrogenase subunit 6 n=1 Tax=Pseudopotamorites peniculus TaxID=2904919 RepID=A0A9E8LP99_9NEOP|nr:NADH dehydrogenase subunit 6 [Pseudopotamorites peniculus]UZZ44309.1 NADH dehydrogenase subunit 6 [Pseudopotamorites peniculus]
MMKLNLMMLMFLLNSFWLLNLNHPLIITIFIIAQTCTLILITGIMGYSFWMSYIMFLTFIGGLLVLFIYISSLTPNKSFHLNYKKIFPLFLLIIMISFSMKFQPIIMNLEMTPLMCSIKFINEENSIYLINFFNKNEMWLTLILMNYLLLALIISTKIILLNAGPMRAAS